MQVPRESAAVVLTDPPYGIAHPCDYNARGRSNLAQARDYPDVAGDREKFDPRFISESGFAVCLWGANYFADALEPSSGWLVWDKLRGDNLDQATCELAWTNFVKGVRRLEFLWDGFSRGSKEELVHPTQKPVALTRWIINLRWMPVDGPIVDPYCGSGSALVAAKKEGRHFLGFELSNDYCHTATQWLGKTTSDGPRLFFKQVARHTATVLETPPVF